MPQFAVYANPGRNDDIPFVVQIQTSRLDRSLGRVVIPLIRVGHRSPADDPLTPYFLIRGQRVHADPLNLVTVPARRLQEVLEYLPENEQDRIIRAIDEMISRA